MFNIQKGSPALRQGTGRAGVDVDFVVVDEGSFHILIAEVRGVFLQEGADMLARGCAIRAAAIQPSVRVNRDNARSVAYKVYAAVPIGVHAAATIGAVFQVAGVVRGGVVVAVDNLLSIHSVDPLFFLFVPLSQEQLHYTTSTPICQYFFMLSVCKVARVPAREFGC